MSALEKDETIAIRGARVHNLQGVDCDLPRNRLVVVTGPSGSGKSSLAFDTLYAEGQRRYVESLSAYARQFLDQMEKPEVDSVTGLSPAIAIEQRTALGHPGPRWGRSPRSTTTCGSFSPPWGSPIARAAGADRAPEHRAGGRRLLRHARGAVVALRPP